jgi:hypothetical protein
MVNKGEELIEVTESLHFRMVEDGRRKCQSFCGRDIVGPSFSVISLWKMVKIKVGIELTENIHCANRSGYGPKAQYTMY